MNYSFCGDLGMCFGRAKATATRRFHHEDITGCHVALIVPGQVFDGAILTAYMIFTSRTWDSAHDTKGLSLSVGRQNGHGHGGEEFNLADDSVAAFVQPVPA